MCVCVCVCVCVCMCVSVCVEAEGQAKEIFIQAIEHSRSLSSSHHYLDSDMLLLINVLLYDLCNCECGSLNEQTRKN